MSYEKYAAKPADGCAWITGASSGIGRALALKLAADGWRVAVTARTNDALVELAGAAEELDGEIIPFAADVTDSSATELVCKTLEETLGPVVLLVANAGIYLPQDGLNGSVDAYRKTFDVNLMGTVNAVLPAVSFMKERGRGQIAIVSSVAGYGGLPTSAAYGASKAGLINLAESLKFDLDLAGISIQVINPGFVDTPATQSNPFPMPFLMTVENAATAIVEGLREPSRFEIAFPKPFVRRLKLVGLLPYRWYFSVLAKSTGWSSKKAV